MKLILGKNSTSNLINIFIQNSSVSTKTGLTGIDYNEVKAYYYKTGEYHTHEITLADSSVGVWKSGGFVEIDATNMPGLYQLQLPDIVVADDSATLADNAVAVFVKDAGANNVTLVTLEIQLIENSLDDFVTIHDTVDANVVSGTLTSVTTVTGNVVGSVGSISAGGIDANTFAAGAITAATLANSAIDLDTFAADVKTGNAIKANVEGMSANTITNDAIAADAEINANVMHWAGFDAQATSSGLPDVNTVNVEEIVETLLKYDFSSISGESSRCVLNSLRKLMNKISLSAVALTVYKEDDTTVAYTQTATTDPAGIDPVVGLDTV